MKHKWELAGDYSVEIWFRIEKNKRGYPTSKEWEQLLGRPLLEGRLFSDRKYSVLPKEHLTRRHRESQDRNEHRNPGRRSL